MISPKLYYLDMSQSFNLVMATALFKNGQKQPSRNFSNLRFLVSKTTKAMPRDAGGGARVAVRLVRKL